MSLVLVDSSVWIDFFHGRSAAVARLDALLEGDRAATTEIIAAEVTSGARSRPAFDELTLHFAALPLLHPPPDLWRRVAEHRFVLARQGHHAHLVDLAIASTAASAGCPLLTRDRDFTAIARVVALELELV